MKDNLLDGHRGKVAANVTTTPTGSGKTEVVGGPGPTNFDDDYNEWELGIGDLIIDLDADIEKNNDKYHGLGGGEGSVTFGLLTQQSCDLTTTSSMSNSKQCRMTGNSNSGSNSGGGASSTGTTGTVEHQATVDKGLKMKIKRKNVGSKFSEAKHEIVQSDTKVAHQTPTEVGAASNCTQNSQQAESKSKHSSGKGRSTSHREKKEKNKDKGGSKAAAEVNGVVNSTHNVVSASIKLTNNSSSSGNSSAGSNNNNSNNNNNNNNNDNNNNAASSTPPAPSTPLPPAPTPTTPCEGNNNNNAVTTTTNCLPSILPSLTVKLETKYSSLPANSTVLLKPEDLPKSPPPKRARLDKADPMRDAGTSTSVGTITEPECLGPCEPGTSVTLEGIVWQETEGGVLVVNVTWRGKTYVGTLLDCTKHDWAPPRFCESPTSDIDAKTSKARGKRGRASTGTASEVNNYNESRATVQSKLRNCKGRRSTSNSSNSTNSGFTVPSSPAKSDTGTCSNGKRKGRPADLELNVTPVDNKGSKRSRSQARSTPTPNNNSLTDFTQPSSPVLIECPEPNCSKKYKHINGLRYHQTHAHSNSEAGKIEDMLEDGKDTTNSSDNDESIQDSGSVSPSPAITTFPSSVSPHSHDSNNRTISAPESLNILDISTPAEGESYSEATDLSTLASVAISDSKKNNAFVHLTTTSNASSSSTVIKSQENGETSTNSETNKPICVNISISGAPTNLSSHVGLTATSPVSLSSPSLTNYATSAASSSSVPSVTASIPTSHVLFNQTCTVGSSVVSTAGSLMNLTSTATMSAMCSVQSNSITTFFTPSVPSTGPSLPSASDKSKLEKADKYKIKSSGTAIVRSVIPVPPAQVLSTSNSSQPSSASHSHVTSSLKPIQPKPTILGEPTTINPALESLKKEKSKHKKKNKERDKDKKGSAILQPTKSQILSTTEESERLGRSSFDNLDSPLTKTITNATGISPSQQKPIVASLGNSQSINSNSDSNAADSSNINENVQSPAYSDISDANDSAPVLESEVPSNKDKDEVKSPPEVASQTAAASLSTYGMYSYYSNPPYLIPSVPQNSVPPSTLNVEKNDSEKKSESDRNKEVRNWNCQPSEVKIENSNVPQEKTGKKTPPEEVQGSNISSAVASSGSAQQEYPMQQQYAYPYGYMQGYPYSAVDATYHMHLLTTDPHYKQQCDQYMEEQERLYREQAERQKEHAERQHKEHIEKQHKEQERQHKEQERQHKEQERQHKEQERHHKEQQERHHKEQERHHKDQDRHHKEQERQHKDQERQHKEHSDKHHKDQSERQHKEHIERQHKDQAERHKLHIQHSQMRSKDDRSREKITEEKGIHSSLSGASIPSDLSKQAGVGNTVIATKDREIRPPSHPSQGRSESSAAPSISPVVSTTTPLKEKQNENHQILKENIELKSQMDPGKVKLTHYESAMLYDRQHEMRRFYMMQEGLVDPHQKSERDHSQQQQQQQQPLQGRKEEMFGTVVMKNKPCTESTRPTSVILSPKSDSAKSLSSSSSSSPKGTPRESSLFSKDYSTNSASSKKESTSSAKPAEHSESSSREEKHKSDKAKAHAEGQKPTMETTGPPPPPTNSYAYIQPSYIQPSHLQPTHLQSSHPHFAHIPFDSIYRGSLSPMLMSASPHYGGSHFIHPQLRYHVPSAPCEIPPHNQAVSDSLGSKLHAPTQAKALDLLHQVSQHYTCTSHKIHELHERALMSPNSSTAPPSAQGSSQSKVGSNEPTANSSKQEAICSNDRSQSPPPQRHLHTHHHTHVGVGYPLYDPYGATHPHWKQAQNQRRVSYRLTDQCDQIGKKVKEQEVP